MAELQAGILTRLAAVGADPVHQSAVWQPRVASEVQWAVRFDVPMQLGGAWQEEGGGDSREEFWGLLWDEHLDRVMTTGMRPTTRSVGVGISSGEEEP